jgi:hypothetical protein
MTGNSRPLTQPCTGFSDQTARLESLSAQQGLNKFALKSKLYINAIRQAFDELQQLKSATA